MSFSDNSYYILSEVAPEGCTLADACVKWYELDKNGNDLRYCSTEDGCYQPLLLTDVGEFTERIFTFMEIKCPGEMSFLEAITEPNVNSGSPEYYLIFTKAAGDCQERFFLNNVTRDRYNHFEGDWPQWERWIGLNREIVVD